jgi:hypothetical protein
MIIKSFFPDCQKFLPMQQNGTLVAVDYSIRPVLSILKKQFLTKELTAVCGECSIAHDLH